MSVANAGTETYTGEGKATMSEAETLEKVLERAKTYALRNAQEKAGVYIRSRSELRDFELVEDEVVTLTSSILKIKEIRDEKTLINGVIQVIVTVTVTIDSDDLQREIDKFLAKNPKRKPAPPVEQPANPPAPPTKKKNLQIPPDAVKYNGHHYYVYPSKFVTWEEAKSFCESLGGHLAIINDAVEDNFLFRYMKSVGVDIAYFGLTDTGHEGTWLWVDNTPLIYKNWGNTEPNGGTHENYVTYLAWVNPNGEWIDGFFNGAAGEGNFICEWDT